MTFFSINDAKIAERNVTENHYSSFLVSFQFLLNKCAKQRTIMQKVADKRRSDFYVVFTMTLRKANFCVGLHIKFIFSTVVRGAVLSLHL